MPRTFIVDVVGNRAFERAKERIVAQTDDVDPDRVTAVYAEITVEDDTEAEAAREPPTTPEPPTEDGSAQRGAEADQNRTQRSHYTEDDRHLGEVAEGSEHETLAIVYHLHERGHDSVTSSDVKEHVVDMQPSTATVALGRLYTKRLLDREKRTRVSPHGGGVEYQYTITDHGRSELQRVGRYEPDPRNEEENPDSVLFD